MTTEEWKELEGIDPAVDSKRYNELMDETSFVTEHPDWYNGPCCCCLCSGKTVTRTSAHPHIHTSVADATDNGQRDTEWGRFGIIQRTHPPSCIAGVDPEGIEPSSKHDI